ncbi:MAG: AIM24 family protein, partial [Candidatus Electrothrix sp. AR3]|nr:AIM24 family protein [Candidatus Electrothrix sp. AR3]
QPVKQLSELANPGAAAPPPTGRQSDEIDYEIFGHEMQFVEVELDPGESVIAEAGGMMYMSDQVKMDFYKLHLMAKNLVIDLIRLATCRGRGSCTWIG